MCFVAQVKTISLSLKGQCSFQLEISKFFPFLDAISPILDLDVYLYSQYGSGSRGAILIRIHVYLDPNAEEKVCVLLRVDVQHARGDRLHQL